MRSAKKRTIKDATAKILFAGVLSFGLVSGATALAQPPAPKPPPPPGEVWKKINPFKKAKKDTSVKTDTTAARTPPAPPTPADSAKKKKFPFPPHPKRPGS